MTNFSFLSDGEISTTMFKKSFERGMSVVHYYLTDSETNMFGSIGLSSIVL